MKLLAIDCSNQNLSLALRNGDQQLNWHQRVSQGHSDHVLTVIDQLLQQAGLPLSSLDTILFGKGPGAFTGLRIAAGVAMGLATAAGCRLVGIPTLDAVARQLPAGNGLAFIDARMGEVYAAHYRAGEACSEIRVYPAAQLPLHDVTALAGDALNLLPAHTLPACHAEPHASDYIDLYLAQPARYPASDSADLLYVRNKIALTAAEQREQKSA